MKDVHQKAKRLMHLLKNYPYLFPPEREEVIRLAKEIENAMREINRKKKKAKKQKGGEA